MSVLAALDIDKAYGERVLLAKASLTIDDGERVGGVGRNGAGKSTFAKILAGVEPSDGGSVALRRGARVAFLAQEPVLDESRSVRATVEEGLEAWLAARTKHEEITARIAAGETTDALLGEQLAASAEVERLGGWDRSHEVERVIDHLGIGSVIERPAGQLSGGQRRRGRRWRKNGRPRHFCWHFLPRSAIIRRPRVCAPASGRVLSFAAISASQRRVDLGQGRDYSQGNRVVKRRAVLCPLSAAAVLRWLSC